MIIPTESTRMPGDEHFYKGNRELAKVFPYESGTIDNFSESSGFSNSSTTTVQDDRSKEIKANHNSQENTNQLGPSGRVNAKDNENLIIQGLANSPLFENPKLLWYVHTPEGEEFGPASGDIFLQWIKERRIGPLTNIWRQDWKNWQEAGKAIPQIKAFFESMNLVDDSLQIENSSAGQQYRPIDNREVGLTEKRNPGSPKSSLSFKIICSLLGLCVILLALLIFLLLR